LAVTSSSGFYLRAQGLGYQHQGRDILSDIDLTLEAGQMTALVGPNGAGKTTLLRCLSGYFRPQMGHINLSGAEKFSKARLLAYMPQKARPAMSLSVYQAVLLGRRPYLRLSISQEDRREVALALARLDLTDLAAQSTEHISAGQYQRVRLACALAQAAPGLLLDEPLNNLDPAYQLKVLNLLSKLARDEGRAILFSLHDLSLASRFAHQVFLLAQGRILACGAPETVLTSRHLSLAYGINIEVEDLRRGGKVFIPGF
jgi:iron complex transport system ATP-binding protein